MFSLIRTWSKTVSFVYDRSPSWAAILKKPWNVKKKNFVMDRCYKFYSFLDIDWNDKK